MSWVEIYHVCHNIGLSFQSTVLYKGRKMYLKVTWFSMFKCRLLFKAYPFIQCRDDQEDVRRP